MRKMIVTGIAVLLTAQGSLGVSSSFWNVRAQEQFAAGELTNTAVSNGGDVTLAPPVELLADTEELYVWSLARDAAGTLYLGTGNNGKLFAMPADGTLSLLADLDEPDILSLAIGSDGALYAGTSGGGIVYRIEPSGSVVPHYDTQQMYVWDLIPDGDGGLFGATGDGGRIYHIDSDGNGTQLFDSPETHIMCLLPGDDGTLYAGGEGKGLVYSLSPSGDPFVLHEVSEPEVCCLARDAQGALYAVGIAVAGGGRRGGPMQGMPMPMPPTTDAAAHAADALQNGAPPPLPAGTGPQMSQPGRAAGGRGSSTVYRIGTDGVVEAIWHTEDDVVHAVNVTADGSLIAGTGESGRLYRIDPVAETWATAAQVPESQVTAILTVGESEMLLGAANMGKLFRLGPGYARHGTLESTRLDASTWSAWGRLTWRAETPRGTSINLETRAGNTSDPDSSWSAWSPVRAADEEGGAIDSPNARFLQWRAELTSSKLTATPTLKSVSVAYQQRNLKPRIHAVTVVPRGGNSREKKRSDDNAGSEGGKPEPRPAPRPQSTQPDEPVSGPWLIKWRASDRNGDRLQYDLHIRRFGDGDDPWTLLEEDLRGESHLWDSGSFPDGLYELRVVATDAPGNPPDVALSAQKASEPVLVDNTPPEIRDLEARTRDGSASVSGTARDATGPITEGYYRVDAGDWVPLPAADGIFDSAEESFAFEVELEPGPHALVVGFEDMAGNRVVERVMLR